MTADERASALLGDALRRAMLDTGRALTARQDESRAEAWAMFSVMCRDYLTPEQAAEVRTATGLVDLAGNWASDIRTDD